MNCIDIVRSNFHGKPRILWENRLLHAFDWHRDFSVRKMCKNFCSDFRPFRNVICYSFPGEMNDQRSFPLVFQMINKLVLGMRFNFSRCWILISHHQPVYSSAILCHAAVCDIRLRTNGIRYTSCAQTHSHSFITENNGTHHNRLPKFDADVSIMRSARCISHTATPSQMWWTSCASITSS